MTETVIVHAAADRVGAATLQTLLAELADHFHYMMLAGTEDRVFRAFARTQAQDLEQWPVGRAFGATGELRWRPQGESFAVCFVGEGDALPAPVLELGEKKSLDAREEDLMLPLWGEHTEEDVDDAGRPVWLEAQIPRLLAYPLEQTPAPAAIALNVRRYRREDETIAFLRFVDLVPAENVS